MGVAAAGGNGSRTRIRGELLTATRPKHARLPLVLPTRLLPPTAQSANSAQRTKRMHTRRLWLSRADLRERSVGPRRAAPPRLPRLVENQTDAIDVQLAPAQTAVM